jgi:hypothetical protein
MLCGLDSVPQLLCRFVDAMTVRLSVVIGSLFYGSALIYLIGIVRLLDVSADRYAGAPTGRGIGAFDTSSHRFHGHDPEAVKQRTRKHRANLEVPLPVVDLRGQPFTADDYVCWKELTAKLATHPNTTTIARIRDVPQSQTTRHSSLNASNSRDRLSRPTTACNATNIFAGEWVFETTLEQSDMTARCPRLVRNLFAAYKLGRNAIDWRQCDKWPYRAAQYEPSGCHIKSESQALNTMFHLLPTVGSSNSNNHQSRHNHHSRQNNNIQPNMGRYRGVALVGDSMMEQLFTALTCVMEEAESRYQMDSFSATMIHSVLLTKGEPCDSRCIDPLFTHWAVSSTASNMTGVSASRHPCFACADNGAKMNASYTFQNFAKRCYPGGDCRQLDIGHHLDWADYIIANVTHPAVVVLTSGVWYSKAQGFEHSLVAYESMLQEIAPRIKEILAMRDAVVWVGMPPVIPSIMPDIVKKMQPRNFCSRLPLYQWDEFAAKDELARRILEPIGVIFVNVSAATWQRKAQNYWVAADGLHWCNNGKTSVPLFLMRSILHLASLRAM